MSEMMLATRGGAVRRNHEGTVMRALFAATMLAVACSSPTGGGDAVADVVVTPQTLTLGIGSQMPVTAQVRDASGNLVPAASVVWTVQDDRIASVSTAGVVTGIALGSTQVAANANGKSGIATVNVQRTPVSSVVVLPNPVNVVVGLSTQLRAITYDAALNELTGRTVAWSSSNDAVARVDGNGLVTTVTVGSVTITATSEGKSGTSIVAVTPPPVVSVTVTPPSVQLIVGQTTTLVATPKDVNGAPVSGRTITWSSIPTAVATVTQAGVVTAVGPGTATVSATADGKTGSSTITVIKPPVASVTVTPPASNIVIFQTLQLTATVKDAGGADLTDRVVVWSSGNTSVATVSQSGLVSPAGLGHVVITATSEGAFGTATVDITLLPVASVQVSPPSATMREGDTSRFTAMPHDSRGSPVAGRVTSWSSSDTKVATVDGTGLVRAIKRGTTTITAAVDGKTDTSALTVTK